MSNRNAEDYPQVQEPLEMAEPAVRYEPRRFPDLQEALDLLNQVALLDQETACIQYPAGDPDQHEAAVEMLREKADRTVNHGISVLSFDIDLTLQTGGEQEEGLVLIEPDVISELQQLGYVVGTCSDREPDDQKKTLQATGQEPHFCIPKEMLGWVKVLIPGERHLHVGDDQKRDRDIAHATGWEHRWPHEFPGT